MMMALESSVSMWSCMSPMTSMGMPLLEASPFCTPAPACVTIFMAAAAETRTLLKYVGLRARESVGVTGVPSGAAG